MTAIPSFQQFDIKDQSNLAARWENNKPVQKSDDGYGHYRSKPPVTITFTLCR